MVLFKVYRFIKFNFKSVSLCFLGDCCGLNCLLPKKDILKVQVAHLTLFGNRFFTDIIKLK